MLDKLIELIKKGDVVAFTGAGASEESGIPTFRGENGLWSKYDPKIYASLPYVFYTFLSRPSNIGEFIVDFYESLLKAKPNPIHILLSILEKRGYLKGVITQNIDNLHTEAGTNSIAELHGNAYKFFCRYCEKIYTKKKEDIESFIHNLKDILYKSSSKILRKKIIDFMGKCQCGRYLLPYIVFFGQNLPQEELKKAYRIIQGCKLLLCIGTSGIVFPAANFPLLAKKNGARIVEINPYSTDLSSFADIVIREKAAIFSLRLKDYFKKA